MADSDSYIDYETFLSPSFSASTFANSLVLNANNPSDTPLDLKTPLSKVLFDLQEVDTHIDKLTSKSAVPLLTHTQSTSDAGRRITDELETQVHGLTESYKRLHKEVIERYEAAEDVRLVAERLWRTVKLGRALSRTLQLARQLEIQVSEVSGSGDSGGGVRAAARSGDHRATTRAASTLLILRQLFSTTGPGEEGEGLERVNIITTLRNDLTSPLERSLVSRTQQIVREFSLSALVAPPAKDSSKQTSQPANQSSYIQIEDTKARTVSAFLTLYLLSPTTNTTNAASFSPTLLTSTLQAYVQTALSSSSVSLSRALATLPTLDRALIEVSARCQNIVALESLLESTRSPQHPLSQPAQPSQELAGNLLAPFLASLDTTSLPSHFWRSLASSLSARVGEIMSRGGVSARTLRSSRDRVRDGLRDCVIRGSKPPGVTSARAPANAAANKTWEREVAVMTGAVIGAIGR